jgi:meiotic recombination protein REC8
MIRPEQLVLQDDPSFLPEFALPPPEVLADLDFGLDLSISRSGDSQSLTPFGSQYSQSSSHTGALGGLVLPTSSPDPLGGGFELQGDNDEAEHSSFLGATDGLDLGEPDFIFDENGEYLEVPVAQNVAGTPAARSAAAMHSDAGASAKVRKEHEEGRMGGAQVSLLLFVTFFTRRLTALSFDL